MCWDQQPYDCHILLRLRSLQACTCELQDDLFGGPLRKNETSRILVGIAGRLVEQPSP
jgi:hypothetical protein